MSVSSAFSQIQDFTPQRRVEFALRECLEGKFVKGMRDLRAGMHLRDIATAFSNKIYGNEKLRILPDTALQDELTRHIAIMELGAIKAVAGTGCPTAQTRAFIDILDHGSLASARMNESKARHFKPIQEVKFTVDPLP